MHESLTRFIKTKHINSFQKLRLLLYLHRHPQMCGGSEEFAERLHFGDKYIVERLLNDLEDVGLLCRVGHQYMLNHEPTLQRHLDELAMAFDHPLSRQNLLEEVRHGSVAHSRLNGYYAWRQSVPGA